MKACLNGDRARTDHPAVPITAAETAAEAAAVQAAGATAVHVHPRDVAGRESLCWADIGPVVAAIRAACPGLPVGVSTREQIEPDVDARLALLAGWAPPADGGPDFASVNWHEDGAAAVAALLVERGIGVEAGLFTPDAAAGVVADAPDGLVRVLVEALPEITPGPDGITAAAATLAVLGTPAVELVVHGEQEWAWPVLRWAQVAGHGIRAGFEDMLVGPAGEPVGGNADLIAFATSRTVGGPA